MLLILFLAFLSDATKADYPTFDYRTRMRVLLLPADLRPGSVIYRLRGTDAEFEYPLQFGVVDDVGKSVVRIENMPCNPTHTYCQANVFLARKLEADRVYDLILSLKDSTGRETKVDSTIKATRASSRSEDIFPYAPGVISVSENAKIGTVLDYVLAKKNPSSSHHSYLELWGSEKFRIVQNLSTKDVTNGSIILTGELDFEEKSAYSLQIFCLDPFTNAAEDTRNVAGFRVPVIVEDDQDMPPVFDSLPPVTKIDRSLRVGDKILKVRARDGDRGNPRPVRYALVTEGNPAASFFNVSEKTGDIFLAKPLKEFPAGIENGQPVILTVLAEETKKNLWEPPAMTATAQVALLLENERSDAPPYFHNEEYVARLPENSPQGTALEFGEPYSAVVRDDDPGRDGVFSLRLENDNGTFEIQPTVGEQKANFVIRVRNNRLLDFEERTHVVFSILAMEVKAQEEVGTPLSSRANVTVYLDDQNDNPPVFLQEKYEVEIPENVTSGTVVVQVQATDVDTGLYGRVFYTRILGDGNGSLAVDSTTGVVTVATDRHGFDREAAEEHRLLVEGRDMEGVGNRATVPLIVKLVDVNDETPRFERQNFEFILQPNLRNFTSRAFVKAVDDDAEEPNNVVRYEIMSGNYENKFALDEVTGELTVRGKLSEANLRRSDAPNVDSYGYSSSSRTRNREFEDDSTSAIVLTVRAYDLGIPHRWDRARVRIYPPDSRARNMNFIVSGANPDKKKIEELLSQLTGGRVTIEDVRPYTGRETGTDLSWKDGSNGEKSVVSATVFYDGNSYVDLNQVEKKLTQNKTQAIVEATVTEYKSKNRLLFWLLMFFLILVLLILLTLVLCCIWQGCCICPWFEFEGKRMISPAKFIAHERKFQREESTDAKAVTYLGRKEAWSGRDDERAFRQEGPKPNREKLVRQVKIESSDDYPAAGATFRSHANDENGGPPNVIYDREFVKREKDRKQTTMVVEDVEINSFGTKRFPYESEDDNEFRRSRSVRLAVNSEKDPDSDSMRRHEAERDSDLDKSFRKSLEETPEKPRILTGYPREGVNVIKEYRLVLGKQEEDENPTDDGTDDRYDREESNREQYYIRDGNAEILRLVTRGNQEERPRTLVQDSDRAFIKMEKGKDLIMKKFMEDQKQTSDASNSRDEFHQEFFRRLQKEFEERNSDGSYQNRSLASESVRPVRPQRFQTSHFVGYNVQNQETQSLPGQMEISTQTEREFGTQTDELSNLRPPRRKVRSDNEFSEEEEENDEEYGDKAESAVEALDLGKGWVRREPKVVRSKKIKRYKMRTPILEEGEIENGIKYDTRPAMFKMPEYEPIVNGTGPGAYTENKSSILRRRKMKEKISMEDEKTAGGANDDLSSGEESARPKPTTKPRRSRRDYLEERKETSETFGNGRTESLNRLYEAVRSLGERELQSIAMETKERAASLNRFYNALAAFEEESGKELKKSTSLNSLKPPKGKPERRSLNATSSPSTESQNPTSEKNVETEPAKSTLGSKENFGSSQSVRESVKTMKPKKSKYMDWYNDLNVNKSKKVEKKEKKKEDDLDSGIAMSSLMGSKPNEINKNQTDKTKTEQLLEKKSVFTIAYDGIRTKTIRPETNSSEKY